ncbi:hypothetical protein VTJ83DRAFT_4418 [Remersonia thermophila]|uniref:HAUS augmin-like complex subunit 6 N-terminal domain-containing protein n=1 Tax=Remersonia thermophila TaxID=72144 RepID=A0ABR4DBD9_9PEZI
MCLHCFVVYCVPPTCAYAATLLRRSPHRHRSGSLGHHLLDTTFGRFGALAARNLKAAHHDPMVHASTMSSLSRTRSLRAPTSVSRSAQGPGYQSPRTSTTVSTATAATTTTTTTSTPSTTTSAAHGLDLALAPPTSPSNVALFLTNLRLLDLDLRPDWPDLTPSLFAGTSHGARHATQDGHKARVQAVEWALYHLFALWDPDDTRARLQPLFPPADQSQSLALRAGLLKGLEQAKKAGVLGRDAVVRKTLLDECRGERLEEVLAAFSSAVLKKVVADRHRRAQRKHGKRHRPALAQTLALEDPGRPGDRAALVALVLAHRVSLARGLDDKQAARARFVEFDDALAAKEQALRRRREAAAAAQRDADRLGVAEPQKREVWRALRAAWTGSERWMEALVYGDAKARKDGLLTAPYDRVWRRVRAGRLAELDEDAPAGLLEQLDARVQEQQERLAKWRGFRERMWDAAGTAEKEALPGRESQEKNKKTKQGIDLGFTAHLTLHVGDKSSRKNPPRAAPARPDAHYEALVNGLRSDLARIGQAAPAIPAFFRKPRRSVEDPEAPEDAEPDVISELGDLEEEGTPPLRPTPTRIRVSEEPAFEPILRKARSFYEDPAAADEADEPLTPSRFRRSGTTATALPHRPQHTPQRPSHGSPALAAASRDSHAPRSPAHSRTPSGARPRRYTLPPSSPPSPPDEAGVPPSPPSPAYPGRNRAPALPTSPSPARKVRHRLSLAERTILSIARRTSQASLRAEAEEDGFDLLGGGGGGGGAGDEVGSGTAGGHDGTPATRRERPRRSRASSMRDDLGAWGEAPPSKHAGDDSNNNNNDSHDDDNDRDDNRNDERPAYEDLAARTRRSLAGTEEARRRAQRERRRSVRKSGAAFPRVEEEEREGSRGPDTTLLLAEELIRQGHDQDYEAVFMSRPKIKMSPVATPVREYWD